ncbi:MAG: 3-dehydroquinate synthase family protein [Candidatus Coproplasma sp.]
MKEIKISVPSGESIIYCGNGAFEERARLLRDKNVFIVTDTNVLALYGDLIRETFGNVPLYAVPAGEKSKNYRQLLKILHAMLQSGVTRASTVVAMGGGVVGDIAGLAACLYMRGVRLVQIPTTLLSQVDSSVGGKTAVDFEGVKNVVGAFYQPQEVIVDGRFLSTLPRRELRCGLGEIIKYGGLDGGIYQKLIQNASALFSPEFFDGIVYDCIAHKAIVVAEDERDTTGARKALNLGHTTGHAFELYYKRKSHGEFVLIGTYYELYIAQKLGVCDGEYADSLRKLIKKVIGKIPAYEDIEKAARFAKFDKKNTTASNISFVAPAHIGASKEIILPAEKYVELIVECRNKIKEEV